MMLENVASRTVKKTSGPPDHLVTTYTDGVWGFEEKWRNQWEDLEEDDIVVFHSIGEDTLGGKWNPGIVGYGVVERRGTKDRPLWRQEKEQDENGWPLLVWFRETYWRGDVGQIGSGSIEEKSFEQIHEDIDALLADSLALSDIEEEFDYRFPVQSSVSGFSNVEGILDRFEEPGLERVIYRSQDREELCGEDSVEDNRTDIGDDVFERLDVTFPPDELFDGLHFPEEEEKRIQSSLSSSLSSGKHVVLTGPPGTGKTELAENVCQSLQSVGPYTGYQVTTATADWSTFDTVGGYMPEEEGDGDLEFTPGQVLRRLVSGDSWRNEPLVIDEINRADIDKAFGQLFTLLAGQRVQLPFRNDGEEIELLPASVCDGVDELARHQYVVPESWRIVATMNSYDKTSLYEMSYAFMRRFAFVRVPVPSLPESRYEQREIVEEYADVWGIAVQQEESEAVGEVWKTMNEAGREIGPAIVKDVLEMVRRERPTDISQRMSRAVEAYVFPQLEGIPERDKIVRAVANLDVVDPHHIEDAATDMLGVTLGDG